MNQLQIFPDSKNLARAVACHFIERAHHAIDAYGRFSVALAGGSTPQKSYQLLATSEFSSQVDWSKVYIFWGDERCVPADDNESNYHMARGALLKHIPIPNSHVYRIEGERKPSDAAHSYQDLLIGFFGEKTRFDLVFLGMGSDGHTASLFPGTAALRKKKEVVSANYVDRLSSWRITLTPTAINHAQNITFVVSGANKANTLKNVVEGEFQPDQYPSQLIRPVQGQLTWYLDSKAASLLDT